MAGYCRRARKADGGARRARRGGAGRIKEEIADELGDLFFVLVNYARMSGYNAEDLTRAANEI